MAFTALSRLFSSMWRRSSVAPSRILAAPAQAPALAPETRAAMLKARSQIGTALEDLQGEFGALNGRLVELKDALGTLRQAMHGLETVNRRRAAPAVVPTELFGAALKQGRLN